MWNSLKSAIFVDEGDQATKPEAPKAAPTSANSMQAAPQVVPMGVNPEFVAAIKKAVFGKQTALTSLVEAADKLANIIPDPVTRFKAAYATNGAGRSVQQIASAADIHLADVEGEELRFKAAVDAKLGAEIGTLENEAKLAEQGVQRAMQHIEQLQRQIAENQTLVGQLQQKQAEAAAAATQKKIELQTTSEQFKAAAQTVRNEITALRQTVVSSLS